MVLTSLSRDPSSSFLSEDFPHPFMEPEGFRAHKNARLETVQNQLNPLHTLTPYFYKLHLYSILPRIHRSLKLSLPVGFAG
jgi:hypothetical protein